MSTNFILTAIAIYFLANMGFESYKRNSVKEIITESGYKIDEDTSVLYSKRGKTMLYLVRLKGYLGHSAFTIRDGVARNTGRDLSGLKLKGSFLKAKFSL